LRGSKDTSNRAVVKAAPVRLLAASTLSVATAKRLIRCYAEGRLLQETEEICGVSRVTVGRIFKLIRKRLLYVRVYRTQDDFIDAKNEAEENGPYFDWERFEKFINGRLGLHRGIRPWNRDLYVSEAIFHFEHNVSAGQVYRLIMLAIEAAGPLNKTPSGYDAALIQRELFRMHMRELRNLVRRMGNDEEGNAFYTLASDGVEMIQEKFVDLIEQAQAEAARPKRRKATRKA
jgi:hypothetical protein